MKTKTLFIMLILGVLLSFSCKKEEKKQASWTEVSEFEDGVVSSIREPGYFLRVNNGFLVLAGADTGEKTDKTKWGDYLSLGERLLIGKTRELTYHYDGKVYEFLEIRRDNGAEGYVFPSHVAIGGNLAVVTDEKAYLHRTPKTVDVSGEILPRKTIVVFYPETEKDGFVQVKAYNSEKPVNVRENNNHVRLSSLSRKQADIQADILLLTAMALPENATNKVRKEAILESALFENSDSVFYEEIYELAYPNTSGVVNPNTLDVIEAEE